MNEDLIEHVAQVILPVMYPQLTSCMEGPWAAANGQQRRKACDAAINAIIAHTEWLEEQGSIMQK